MRSGIGPALCGWPGGALSIRWAVRLVECCERHSAIKTANAKPSDVALLEEGSAATSSGANVVLQTTGPLEWQQAEARTQCCAEAAARAGRGETTVKQRMPQDALASGASTSRRANARASCARRCIPFSVAGSASTISVTDDRGGAVTARWSRRAARNPASRPGCAG